MFEIKATLILYDIKAEIVFSVLIGLRLLSTRAPWWQECIFCLRDLLNHFPSVLVLWSFGIYGCTLLLSVLTRYIEDEKIEFPHTSSFRRLSLLAIRFETNYRNYLLKINSGGRGWEKQSCWRRLVSLWYIYMYIIFLYYLFYKYIYWNKHIIIKFP